MKISLIITTYNWPEALELCLLSVLAQTIIPYEVIVADDGSSDETRKLIEKIAGYSDRPIVHSWQEDKGFRAAKSRNKAVNRATGDYIVLIDGDLILDKSFMKDHIDNAHSGQFIQGSRVIISKEKTDQTIESGGFELFFYSAGIENRKNCIRSKILSKVFSGTGNKLEGIRSCNLSFWKKDAVSINGFNEEFVGWGGEDSEFACRLMNSGVKRFNLRFLATAFHLFHPICTREKTNKNYELLENCICHKPTWCTKGLINE